MATVPAVGLVLVVAAVLLVVFVREPLPTDGGEGARLLDVTGETEFAQLTAEFPRDDVALATLPPHTIEAVLAAEDADFHSHAGVSIPGVVRALVANVRSGEVTQGGSTITQQYIKVVSREDAQTLWRKVREAALAIKLERTYTKDEILERYLNVVYFGRGAYGIQAAAQAYFGVDASQLSLAQSAVLAGVLPAPSLYDPLVDIQSSH
ncbi:MAG TPA: biosynthetic peptidoglycan transglycosylase, partial [Euzebya sp.]|nr:biosynthetic peptidoglycan transglycosylase [Euzebya sp.]